jgi:hypothetical protein
MTAHGKNLEITTYTGGCGTEEVDVNPHVTAKIEAILTVSCELVNDKGATLARSGVLYRNVVWVGSPVTIIRWRAKVPGGGAKVHVYGDLDGEVVKDTATCRT